MKEVAEVKAAAVQVARAANTQRPKSVAQVVEHPSLYTLHSAPCTLHPAPCTLHPVPYTLQCTGSLHPAPGTLHLPFTPPFQWSVVDVQKWLRRHCGDFYHLYCEAFLEQV